MVHYQMFQQFPSICYKQSHYLLSLLCYSWPGGIVVEGVQNITVSPRDGGEPTRLPAFSSWEHTSKLTVSRPVCEATLSRHPRRPGRLDSKVTAL